MIFMFISDSSERMVEAIEEGKIVKVSESYAKKEGLLILRKEPIPQSFSEKMGYRKPGIIEEKKEKKFFIPMDDLRKPLKRKGDDITKDLIENFHWKIVQRRRERGLTRKQVANAIGESELDLKVIENGVLPANNFVLISKLEDYYGMALRKNKSIAPVLTRALGSERISNVLKRVAEKKKEEAKKMTGGEGAGKTGGAKEDNLDIDFSGSEIELAEEEK